MDLNTVDNLSPRAAYIQRFLSPTLSGSCPYRLCVDMIRVYSALLGRQERAQIIFGSVSIIFLISQHT